MEAPSSPATKDGGNEAEHPWPYLQEMFSYVGVKYSSYLWRPRHRFDRLYRTNSFENLKSIRFLFLNWV